MPGIWDTLKQAMHVGKHINGGSRICKEFVNETAKRGWMEEVVMAHVNSMAAIVFTVDGREDSRCRVPTRVRVEQGRTTGVMDRGTTEQEEEQERQWSCLAHSQILKNFNRLKQ